MDLCYDIGVWECVNFQMRNGSHMLRLVPIDMYVGIGEDERL